MSILRDSEIIPFIYLHYNAKQNITRNKLIFSSTKSNSFRIGGFYYYNSTTNTTDFNLLLHEKICIDPLAIAIDIMIL